MPPVLTSELQEFSTRTGKVIRALYPVQTGGESLVWTNGPGSVLVVAAPPRHHNQSVYGVLIGNRFTPIPGAPAANESVAVLAF